MLWRVGNAVAGRQCCVQCHERNIYLCITRSIILEQFIYAKAGQMAINSMDIVRILSSHMKMNAYL